MKPALFLCFVSLVIVSSLTGYFACSSGNSNPVASPPTRPSFATFAVGASYQFQQWSIDTTTGGKIISSLLYVHEKITSANFSANINGQLYVAYLALDSTFDAGNTSLLSFDSVYYCQVGEAVYYFGLPAQVIRSLFNYSNGSIALVYKWNKIIDQGNTNGWITDTTAIAMNYNGAMIYPSESLNGNDVGDTTITINNVNYSTDHSHHMGSINAQFTQVPLAMDVYMSYAPCIVAKMRIAPSRIGATAYCGVERDLVAIQ